MSATSRLAGFGVALVAALGLGAGLGAVAGPTPTRSETAPGDEAPAPEGEGVVASLDGYRFEPVSSALDPAGGTFEFVIRAPDGEPQRAFEPVHERALHLVVVSRELTTFHHVHPHLDASGTWSVELPALPAGSYRAVADFLVTGGPRLALGTDLSVAGSYTPGELAAPSPTSTVDGYEVTLATEQGGSGEVVATLTVRRDGEVVTLEPYLGAQGHLVALRAGDLAYAHVHPIDEPDGGGAVTFSALLPSAGRYGLFFDFKHRGVVRTAAFTLDQGATAGGTPSMEH